MLHFIYGILFAVAAIPIIRQSTSLVCTLLDYWETTIAEKAARIQMRLEVEHATLQAQVQELQLPQQEATFAVAGFEPPNTELLEYDEDEEEE